MHSPLNPLLQDLLTRDKDIGFDLLKADQVVGAVALIWAVLAAVPALLAAPPGIERAQPSDTTLHHRQLPQLRRPPCPVPPLTSKRV